MMTQEEKHSFMPPPEIKTEITDDAWNNGLEINPLHIKVEDDLYVNQTPSIYCEPEVKLETVTVEDLLTSTEFESLCDDSVSSTKVNPTSEEVKVPEVEGSGLKEFCELEVKLEFVKEGSLPLTESESLCNGKAKSSNVDQSSEEVKGAQSTKCCTNMKEEDNCWNPEESGFEVKAASMSFLPTCIPTNRDIIKRDNCYEVGYLIDNLQAAQQTYPHSELVKQEDQVYAPNRLTQQLKTFNETHSRQILHICDECSKVFSEEASLKRHKRSHTGQKPYICDECGKGYTRRADLKRHKRTHTREEPYKCDECGKGFFNKERLERHLRTHTCEKPYKCDECGKGFIQARCLILHKRTHTGQKPYTCGECGKMFSQKGSLKRHKIVHTGQKPYKCDECVKEFSRTEYLKRHKSTHTGEKQ